MIIIMDDNLIEELIARDAILNHNDQVRYDNKIFKECDIDEKYTSITSLLHVYTSEKYVEFDNNEPSNFITYKILVTIGSSNNINEHTGIASIENNKIKLTECNFYPNYFLIHPSEIDMDVKCDDHNCNINEKMTEDKWCKECFGELQNASQLIKIMNKHLKIISIPLQSILYIEKSIEKIDFDNYQSMHDLMHFLNNDKKKISILESNISETKNKIRQITERLITYINFNENMMNIMLLSRGGTLEAYNNTIQRYSDKFNSLTRLL